MNDWFLSRMGKLIQPKLIPQRARFWPGKTSTSQVTEHIEKCFEEQPITGVAFVYLSSAFDNLNHQKLLTKIYNVTKHYKLKQVISLLLRNRRFLMVRKAEKRSKKWPSARKRFFFNSKFFFKPTTSLSYKTKRFNYVDDLDLAMQSKDFDLVEAKLWRKSFAAQPNKNPS